MTDFPCQMELGLAELYLTNLGGKKQTHYLNKRCLGESAFTSKQTNAYLPGLWVCLQNFQWISGLLDL